MIFTNLISQQQYQPCNRIRETDHEIASTSNLKSHLLFATRFTGTRYPQSSNQLTGWLLLCFWTAI